MSLAPTFGSFGDFVSAIQLLYQLRQSLRRIGGSSSQYQSLIDDIGAFHILLVQVGNLNLTSISLATEHALKHHVMLAAQATEAFLSQISPYHASLTAGGSGRRFIDTWVKMKWGILKGDDVKEFRDRINGQAIAIGVLLNSANVLVVSYTEPRPGRILISVY